MATVNLYLDRRRAKSDGSHLLKLSVTHQRAVRYISLGIYLSQEQWDGSAVISSHPLHRKLNLRISRSLLEAEEAVLDLEISKKTQRLQVKDYAQAIDAAINGKSPDVPTFADKIKAFASLKKESTKNLYLFTLKRITDYCPKINSMSFEDITRDWLVGFDNFLAKTAPSKNYRNIHLRNIRAVFNAAIDDGVTEWYPFRRFKISPEKTRKRSLPVEDLRRLFDYPVEPYAELYRDMFTLIFMLIGINTVDLHGLKCVTEDNRIEYKRAKTGRLYSIKVEPEALEIIRKYNGENGLLSISDRWSDSRNFRHQCNKALQLIGAQKNKGGRIKGGTPKKTDTANKPKGIWPELTTYWARHSWATVAASLDIPKDTIAAALGHGGNTVTDIYIDFDQSKVDEANRRVLDWVLYGKK